MSRARTRAAPSDEEILSYDNVPVEVAATFIGWGVNSVKYALRDERAPFGMAAQNPETRTWSYNISPGSLVKYKHGELPVCRIDDLVALVSEGVDQILKEKLSAARFVPAS